MTTAGSALVGDSARTPDRASNSVESRRHDQCRFLYPRPAEGVKDGAMVLIKPKRWTRRILVASSYVRWSLPFRWPWSHT